MHVTRHHDNWHERSAVISSDATTNFIAFDVGKDIIDQNQIGYNAGGFFYAVQTGKRGGHLQRRIGKRK